MTQVMKNITHQLTGKLKYINQPFDMTMDVTEVPMSMSTIPFAKEVVFELNWRRIAHVKDTSAIPQVKKDMVESFRRTLYSDVEDHVLGIMESLYQMDDDEAMTKCRKLMQYLGETQ